MYYIAVMWLVTIATIMFAEYFHAFSSVGKTQIYADILSDGTAFVGNNGWGLDEFEATNAYTKLISLNRKYFKNCTPENLVFTNTNEKGQVVAYDQTLSGEKNKNNTTNVTVKLNTKTITTKRSLKRIKKSSTRITYSGGMKVVLEAYKHSYEYNPASQTWYVWGGGHGISPDSLAWEQTADCSGFVSGVFRKCGYDLTSEACTWDMEGMGKQVPDLDSARPGDIILFWYGGSTSQHVAIYAGKKNGTPYIIHSRGGQDCTGYNPGRGAARGVHITPLSAVGYSKIMIRRIVDTCSDAYEIQIQKIMNNGMTFNQAVVVEGLRSAGYGDVQIAAILGNFAQESGCDPYTSESIERGYIHMSHEQYAQKIQNGEIQKEEWLGGDHMGKNGYGLVQWTYNTDDHERKPGLWDYAKMCGSNVTNIYIQTQYFINEMTNGSQSGCGYYDSTFRSITDVATATEYFCRKFERAGIPMMGNRIREAQINFSKLQNISY